MLLSVTVPSAGRVLLAPGLFTIWAEHTLVRPAVGYGLFDVPSEVLPAAGVVEIDIVSPLDGRLYEVRRSLEMPDQWQVIDAETGWLAAGGSGDARRWLGDNLVVAGDLPLPRLFLDFLTFSVPETGAWLLHEPGLRERKLHSLLRTERYPLGLRWVDDVREAARSRAHTLEGLVQRCAGRDALFTDVRRLLDTARRASSASSEHVEKVRAELGQARLTKEQWEASSAELREVRQQLQKSRESLASLEAQAERWRHWLAVSGRAQHSMRDHEPQRQAYEAACLEIGKIGSEVATLEAVRREAQSAEANVLELEREARILEAQLADIGQAETAAADLDEKVQRQQQLEQELAGSHEQATHLQAAKRAVQQALGESKRIEVLLADVEQQLGELEQLAPQVASVKKLQVELDEHLQQVRDAARQVDHLRFLETAAHTLSGYLDDLRKEVAATERLEVAAGGNGNGAGHGEQSRESGHLREVVDHQMASLERQLRDWQLQGRELADAPAKVTLLRTSIHRIEQELAAARQVEVRLGGLAALKQHRKYLLERYDELGKTIETRTGEQQESGDAQARLTQLRQDISALRDPRAERQVLLRTAARKNAAQSELRHLQRRLATARERRDKLAEHLAVLEGVRESLAAKQAARDQAQEGYCAYLAQEAITEVAADSARELAEVTASLAAERQRQAEGEARETVLAASLASLQDGVERVASLQARLEEAETRAVEWTERYQAAADEYAVAEENRKELKRHQAELASQRRALELLETARADIVRLEAAFGAERRSLLAASATSILRKLVDEPEAELRWEWGEAPALVKAGASQRLDRLSPLMQTYCVLALRLALAADASHFRSVFVAGLGSLQRSEEFVRKLPAVPGFDQFLVPFAA